MFQHKQVYLPKEKLDQKRKNVHWKGDQASSPSPNSKGRSLNLEIKNEWELGVDSFDHVHTLLKNICKIFSSTETPCFTGLIQTQRSKKSLGKSLSLAGPIKFINQNQTIGGLAASYHNDDGELALNVFAFTLPAAPTIITKMPIGPSKVHGYIYLY